MGKNGHFSSLEKQKDPEVNFKLIFYLTVVPDQFLFRGFEQADGKLISFLLGVRDWGWRGGL